MTLNSVILILIYPAIFFCAVDPEAYKWGRTHGLGPMPPALLERVERRGRLWYFVKFMLTAILLGVWVAFRSIPVKEIVLGLGSPSSLRIAEFAGILVVSRFAFQNLFPRVKRHFVNHPLQRGSLPLWILIFLLGGLTEEAWRALCLASLQRQGLQELLGLLIVSIAFTVAQAAGIPARIAGIREEASWQMITGVTLGELFLVSHTFLVPAAVGFCLNVFNLWQIWHTSMPEDHEKAKSC